MAKTKDGLAVVTEKTFLEFLEKYKITSASNNPVVTARIKSENPQLYRILDIGTQNAPTREARVYYECGMQIAYELLRRQSALDKQKK